jgi:hypothetical protein
MTVTLPHDRTSRIGEPQRSAPLSCDDDLQIGDRLGEKARTLRILAFDAGVFGNTPAQHVFQSRQPFAGDTIIHRCRDCKACTPVQCQRSLRKFMRLLSSNRNAREPTEFVSWPSLVSCRLPGWFLPVCQNPTDIVRSVPGRKNSRVIFLRAVGIDA